MKKILIIALSLFAVILTASEYTLDDLIKAGLENAYSLKQKEIMQINADLSLNSAKWDLLPEVNFSASRTNQDGRYSSSGGVTISKTITNNDPTYYSLRQSAAEQQIATLDVMQAKKDLIYNIYTGWLGIIEKQKELTIRQENLKVLQGILEQSRLLKDLGKKTAYDCAQSEINLIDAQLSIEQLKNTMAEQRQNLFSSLKLQDNGSVFSDEASGIADTTLVFDAGKELPLNLKKIKEEMYLSRISQLQQKLSIYPTLSVTGSYREASANNDLLALGDYEDTYSLSMNLSWSLWNPWTKSNSFARTKNSLLLQQWQYEDSQITLNNNLSSLQREWDALKLSLRLNTRKSIQAQENLRIAQERYTLGNLTQIELDQARIQSLEAQLALNQIQFNLLRKVQEWKLLYSLPILDKY